MTRILLARDEARDRDHPFTLGHDRVVGALERVAVRISAVKGRDEVALLVPGRVIGAPGGRARASMHDVDAMVVDQLLEQLDVGAHGEGVLGIHRQGDVLGAGAPQFALHRPARRDHDGPRSGRGDRLGDIHRAALDTAGHQVRQYLHHRDSPQAVVRSGRPGGFAARRRNATFVRFVH
jgi:hypothetical protein